MLVFTKRDKGLRVYGSSAIWGLGGILSAITSPATETGASGAIR